MRGDYVEWEELENFKLETRYPVDPQSIFDFIPFPNPSDMVILNDHHRRGSLYIRVILHIACHCIALLDTQFSNLRTPQSLVSEMAEYSKPDYKLSEMYSVIRDR